MEKQPCVYILASGRAGTLYTGVTSDLLGRLYKHREGITKGFASKHNALRLVWYEMYGNMESATIREKRIKKWKRDWKLNLIEQSNRNGLTLPSGWASSRCESIPARGNDGVIN